MKVFMAALLNPFGLLICCYASAVFCANCLDCIKSWGQRQESIRQHSVTVEVD